VLESFFLWKPTMGMLHVNQGESELMSVELEGLVEIAKKREGGANV